MSITLEPARPEHLEALARICHLAFNTLHDHHRIPADVPTEEVGRLIIGGVLHRPDYVGMVAMRDGRAVGSNFLLLADEVCGVGPITVEPGIQGGGVGRALMSWAIEEARRRRGPGVRVQLFQEAVNAASLSLYASLGFEWCESAALMQPTDAGEAAGLSARGLSVRAMTRDDLPAVAEMSARIGGMARGQDAARLLEMGLPALVSERDRRVTGYQIATLFGHGAAESDVELLGLARAMMGRLPNPAMGVVIVPLSNAGLFTGALASGFRTLKTLNAMSIGGYTAARGAAFPSIQR